MRAPRSPRHPRAARPAQNAPAQQSSSPSRQGDAPLHQGKVPARQSKRNVTPRRPAAQLPAEQDTPQRLGHKPQRLASKKPSKAPGKKPSKTPSRIAAVVERADSDYALPFAKGADPAPARSEQSARVLNMEQRWQEKRAYRRRVTVRRVLIGLAGLALAAVIIWLVFFSAVFRFSAERVHVSGTGGTSIIQLADVQAVLSSYEGEQMVLLKPNQIAADLEQIAEVRSAHVSLRFPRSMTVELTAQQPFVCWGVRNACAVIARDGAVLHVPQELHDTLPLLKVADSSLKAADAVRPVVAVLADLDPDIAKRIREYALSQSGQVSFTLDSGATVHWGTASAGAFKNRVLKVLLTEEHEMYDVSIPSSPVTR